MPRKVYRKKAKRKVPAKPVKSIPFILPSTHLCKLRYNTNISLDASTGSTAYHLMRANDIYDPDATGIGHQPLGFDQLKELYGKFIVLGARARATFHSNTSTDGAFQYVGILPTTDSGLDLNPEILLEQKGIRKRLLGPMGGSNAVVTSHANYSAKRWWGGKILTNSAQQGAYNASPSEIVNFGVWCASTRATVSPTACFANVTVEYVVLFKDLRSLVGS